LTAIHHGEGIAELLCKIKILLDQHNRHRALIPQIGYRAPDIFDD
jgi:hypothetical protein